MTNRELQEKLKEFPDDLEVWVDVTWHDKMGGHLRWQGINLHYVRQIDYTDGKSIVAFKFYDRTKI
jgi:hypothetical protein